MARQKKTIISGVTRDAMETAFAEYAIADAEIAKINATMDVQFTKIREKHQDDLEEHTKKKVEAFEIMQAFAVEQRDVLFTKKKSMDTTHGTLGFRTGNPKLKTRKGFTWPAVTKILQELFPQYVRSVVEPAKDKLLADRDDENAPAMFEKVGIYVDQDETFYVEPKKEED